MARFGTKRKKKFRRKMDYNERMIVACKERMTDQRLGYEIPDCYYEEKYKLNKA